MEKHVVSTTLDSPAWSNTTVVRDDVPGAVRALKERVGGDVLLNGSGTLLRTLLEHDLVDELRLMVFPVVLGAGRRLFPEGLGERPFALAETRQTGEVAILRLRRA
jgi:dihydrofolate reductase